MLLQLTPQILKPAVADALVELMAPIQTKFEASPEWQEIMLKAYPPPPKKAKKEKKLGTHYASRPKENAKDNAKENADAAAPAAAAPATEATTAS